MNINKPYSFSKDIGTEYNAVIERSFEEWVVLMDIDTCFLTPTQPLLIPKYLQTFGGDCGLFTCYTNRVGYQWQRYQGVMSENDSMAHHIGIARGLEGKQLHVTELPELISGFFMIVKKDVWREVGGFKKGLLGVDDDFSKKVSKAGYKVKRMDTLYLWHSYRLDKDYKDTSHL